MARPPSSATARLVSACRMWTAMSGWPARSPRRAWMQWRRGLTAMSTARLWCRVRSARRAIVIPRHLPIRPNWTPMTFCRAGRHCRSRGMSRAASSWRFRQRTTAARTMMKMMTASRMPRKDPLSSALMVQRRRCASGTPAMPLPSVRLPARARVLVSSLMAALRAAASMPESMRPACRSADWAAQLRSTAVSASARPAR